MKNKYYSLATEGETATINIYGDIVSWPFLESDVSVWNLSKKLDELQDVKNIDVYINSYGGEVAEGLAIYNALKRKSKEAKVTTYCDGFACSIASVIFMAGTERKMSNASLLMIHNAWTAGQGNADELRKMADDLDIITSASVSAYTAVANISEKKIRELMDKESWITPKDAKKYGFATEIIEEKEEKPSQSVKNMLYDIVVAHQNGEFGVFHQDSSKDEQENENGVKGGENAPDDAKDNEDVKNDEPTKEEENQNIVSDSNKMDENPDETKNSANYSGFFNAIMNI